MARSFVVILGLVLVHSILVVIIQAGSSRIEFDCTDNANKCSLCDAGHQDCVYVFSLYMLISNTSISCNSGTDDHWNENITHASSCLLDCESWSCVNAKLRCDDNNDTAGHHMHCVCNGENCPRSGNIDVNAEETAPIPVDESLLIMFLVAFFLIAVCCLGVLCIAVCMSMLYYGEKRKHDDKLTAAESRRLSDGMIMKDDRNLSFISVEKSDVSLHGLPLSYNVSSRQSSKNKSRSYDTPLSHHSFDEKEHEDELMPNAANPVLKHNASSSSYSKFHHLQTPQRKESNTNRKHAQTLHAHPECDNEAIPEMQQLAVQQLSDDIGSQHEGSMRINIQQQGRGNKNGVDLEMERDRSRRTSNSEELYEVIPNHHPTLHTPPEKKSMHVSSDLSELSPCKYDQSSHGTNDDSNHGENECAHRNQAAFCIAISRQNTNRVHDDGNDSDSDKSASTLTVRTRYTMDGHTSHHHDLSTSSKKRVCPKKIFIDSARNRKVDDSDDILVDISAKLPPSPVDGIQNEIVTRHPPKAALLRPPTVDGSGGKGRGSNDQLNVHVNGKNDNMNETGLDREHSLTASTTAVGVEGHFAISPIVQHGTNHSILLPRKVSMELEEADEDDERTLPDDEAETQEEDEDEDGEDEEKAEHLSARDHDESAEPEVIHEEKQDDDNKTTASVTTFATYNNDGDYKQTMNPLCNLNPLRRRRNVSVTLDVDNRQSRSNTVDTRQSESVSNEDNDNHEFSEMSRTTSAAAVHLPFPNKSGSGRKHDSRKKTPFNILIPTNFNRVAIKSRSNHQNEFISSLKLTLPSSSSSNKHHKANSSNTVTKLRITPPHSTKDSPVSISTPVFDVEPAAFVSKMPSSTMIPSLPNSPLIDREESARRPTMNEFKKQQPLPISHQSNLYECDIPPPPPLLKFLDQKSDDSVVRKTHKSKKTRPKLRGRRDQLQSKDSGRATSHSPSGIAAKHADRSSNPSEVRRPKSSKNSKERPKSSKHYKQNKQSKQSKRKNHNDGLNGGAAVVRSKSHHAGRENIEHHSSENLRSYIRNKRDGNKNYGKIVDNMRYGGHQHVAAVDNGAVTLMQPQTFVDGSVMMVNDDDGDHDDYSDSDETAEDMVQTVNYDMLKRKSTGNLKSPTFHKRNKRNSKPTIVKEHGKNKRKKNFMKYPVNIVSQFSNMSIARNIVK